jgi:hypothetical protein
MDTAESATVMVFADIAKAIGVGLGLPTESKPIGRGAEPCRLVRAIHRHR